MSHISQILRLSGTSVRCVVEGRHRARMRRLWQTEPFLQANVEALEEEPESEAFRKSPPDGGPAAPDLPPFRRVCPAGRLCRRRSSPPLMDDHQPVGRLADFIAQNIALRYQDKQEILEEFSPPAARSASSMASWPGRTTSWALSMRWRARSGISWPGAQREQILRTQIRVLQNELGRTATTRTMSWRPTASVSRSCIAGGDGKTPFKGGEQLAKQPFGSAEGP